MYILYALLMTLCVEMTVYLFVKPFSYKTFFIMFAFNCLLNPSMNLILNLINDTNIYALCLTIFEVMTTIIEAVILIFVLKYDFVKGILISTLANMLSLFIGSIVNLFIINENGAFICSVLLAIYLFVLLDVILFRLIFVFLHKKAD